MTSATVIAEDLPHELPCAAAVSITFPEPGGARS